MQEIITHSVEETQSFAREFAKKITFGDVITLSGELGAGKTTFVQGFAEGLGITKRIISPTFIIMRTYEITHPKGTRFTEAANDELQITHFHHVDLYRISDEDAIEELGLLEVLRDAHTVTVIEWPERMGSQLPKKRWDIQIESIDEDTRKIMVSYLSS